MTDDGAPDRHPRGVVGSAARAARRRKGAHRQGDELARRRQELPWVRIEKGYVFEVAARSHPPVLVRGRRRASCCWRALSDRAAGGRAAARWCAAASNG
ncbi:MAG: DUF899 family protein [Solirubrobacterales bacterium]|nr:DUF899 family protein [Solirubrobacterales bacterium]MBV8940155.1 DUF899 family protein [Solirubrobacterales bacterium]